MVFVDVLQDVSVNEFVRHVMETGKTYLDYRVGDQVADTEVFLEEKPNFGGRDVILYDLADYPDVVLVLSEGSKCLIDVGARPFDYECAVGAEDDVQIGK